MDDEALKKKAALEKRFQYESEEYLDRIKATQGAGSLAGQVANNILTERRRELSRSARTIARATVVTAIATVVAALAALIAIYFQYCQPQAASDKPHQAASSTALTPSTSPSSTP